LSQFVAASTFVGLQKRNSNGKRAARKGDSNGERAAGIEERAIRTGWQRRREDKLLRTEEK